MAIDVIDDEGDLVHQTRSRLGTSDIHVSRMGLGTNSFGWTASRDESFRMLDAYVDAGGNFVDTADVYSAWVDGHAGGESEQVIGEWIQRRGGADDVVLATKVGMHPDAPDLSENSVRRGLEASLQRLGVERIDVYYLHRHDADTPLAETYAALAGAIDAGLVRSVGVSNVDGLTLRAHLRAAGSAGLSIDSVQLQYNLLQRASYETSVAPLAERAGFGLVGWAGLAKGVLTGKYLGSRGATDTAWAAPVTALVGDQADEVVTTLVGIAQRYGQPPAAVALSWAAGQPTAASALGGARSVEQLQDLLPALHLELSPDDREELTLVSGVRGPDFSKT